MSRSKPDPCQRFACALQTCLQAKDYQEWKCSSVMDALYECCSTAGSDSVVCSGIKPREITNRPAPLKFKHAKIIKDTPKDEKKPPKVVEKMPDAVTGFTLIVDGSPEALSGSPESVQISSEDIIESLTDINESRDATSDAQNELRE